MNQYETATQSLLLQPHRERAERRSKRAALITGSVIAALVVGGIVATGTAAMAEEPTSARQAATVQLATGHVAEEAKASIEAAESVMKRAELDGILYLRDVADCDALRERLDRGGTVVVVGSGWIGWPFLPGVWFLAEPVKRTSPVFFSPMA